ncbi:MAG: type II toxin-antitoxin system HipA family toxin YjjJ [Proteobacteria bacterium]|nr:type II toxin-antitoxin system HipA family toxin YjjJ [Pseudomonadota bacterium]
MRPLLQAARDQLADIVRRQPAIGTPDLAARLGVSLPTVRRMLNEAAARGEVLSLGRARRTRHVWRRALRGQVADWPVYRVDAEGRAEPFAQLTPIEPQGTVMPMAGVGWPLPDESRDGVWPGLPYPLQDMRPQGYMGRQFARAVSDSLQLPPDPRAWGDDEVLIALARAGSDMVGDLVLGDEALRRWQAARLDAAQAPSAQELPEHALADSYPALADQAVAGGGAGSSAAGQFPKFAALRAVPAPEQPGPGGVARTPHVLVKFSGAGGTQAEQRWADLLLAEHLALQVCATQLADHGVTTAYSRVRDAAGRRFLEVERFDRHGLWGRSPLVSLESVNAAFLGLPHRPWPELMAALARARLLAEGAEAAAAVLWWFGRLIGNSDMHLGNLSLRPRGGLFSLAPAYDMLPMRHAPLAGGELPPLGLLEPALPLPTERTAWWPAAEAAGVFWRRVAEDARASDALRTQAQANAGRLAQAQAVLG